MTPDVAVTKLRVTVRHKLLRHLEQLADADPQQRAAAALAASQLMRQHGLEWRALLPAGSHATEASTPPPDWRTQALVLAHHPAVTGSEQAFLFRLAGWRAPGSDGLARLREIAGRAGFEI